MGCCAVKVPDTLSDTLRSLRHNKSLLPIPLTPRFVMVGQREL